MSAHNRPAPSPRARSPRSPFSAQFLNDLMLRTHDILNALGLRSHITSHTHILQIDTEADVAQQEAQIQQLAESKSRDHMQTVPHLALTVFFLEDHDLLGEREWEWEAAPLRWLDAGDLRPGEAERGRTRPTEAKTADAREPGAGDPPEGARCRGSQIVSLAPPLLSTFFLLCAVRVRPRGCVP